MKGITFIAKGEAAFVEEDEPQCPHDGVLMKTLYSGLSNGTERNKLMGGNYHRGQYPDRIGYQHVSEIIEVGSHVSQFAVGDIVSTGNFPGHVPRHACRERDLIVKLPPDADLPACALMAVAAVAYHNARRAQITPDDRVLVYGDGMIGQFAAPAAMLMGAHVSLAGHHEHRLAVARQAGLDIVINNSTEEGDKQVVEGKPYSVVMECSGGEVIEQVFGRGWGNGILTKPGKVMLIAGRRDIHVDFNAGSGYHAEIHFSTHFTRDELHEVARLVERGRINLRACLREVVQIDQALDVYRRLRDEKGSLLGTVFDWTQSKLD